MTKDGRIIVCLCGPARNRAAYESANAAETLAGRIVLSIGSVGPAAAADPATKAALDALHRDKVRVADEVLVLNVGGYVGESTRQEIALARALGKPVRFLEPERPDLPPPRCEKAHMQVDVKGALLNWVDREWDGVVTDDDGRNLTGREAKRLFLDKIAAGWLFLPYGECPDFDPATGCRRHRYAALAAPGREEASGG